MLHCFLVVKEYSFQGGSDSSKGARKKNDSNFQHKPARSRGRGISKFCRKNGKGQGEVRKLYDRDRKEAQMIKWVQKSKKARTFKDIEIVLQKG